MALRKLLALLTIAPTCLALGCAVEPTEDEADESTGALAETPGLVDPAAVQGRDRDGSYPTQVWKVTRDWNDKNAATGNTFEKDYSDWVASLPKTSSLSRGETITVKTPRGAPYERELAAPVLEAAHTAIFARVAYASWMGLPFYLKSGDLHAGHFGFVAASGKPHPSCEAPDCVSDFRAIASPKEWRSGQPWPSDASLRRKNPASYKQQLSFVDVTPGTKGGAGAWFDEVLLDKRVGHFLVTLIDLFDPVKLAQDGNMVHVTPEATAPGDVLLHRHSKHAGVGHAFFVYQTSSVPEGRMRVELLSGSMPARQAAWLSPKESRDYFLAPSAGGPKTVEECPAGYSLAPDDASRCRKATGTIDKPSNMRCPAGYFDNAFDEMKCVRYTTVPSEKTDLRTLGGGIRRFQTPVLRNGRWTNTASTSVRSTSIGDKDVERIGARIKRFQQLLVD